jgi:hypothetical protein
MSPLVAIATVAVASAELTSAARETSGASSGLWQSSSASEWAIPSRPSSRLPSTASM